MSKPIASRNNDNEVHARYDYYFSKEQATRQKNLEQKRRTAYRSFAKLDDGSVKQYSYKLEIGTTMPDYMRGLEDIVYLGSGVFSHKEPCE